MNVHRCGAPNKTGGQCLTVVPAAGAHCGWHNGTDRAPRRSEWPRRVPVTEHSKIAARIQSGESAESVARDYPVGAARIQQIARGEAVRTDR